MGERGGNLEIYFENCAKSSSERLSIWPYSPEMPQLVSSMNHKWPRIHVELEVLPIIFPNVVSYCFTTLINPYKLWPWNLPQFTPNLQSLISNTHIFPRGVRKVWGGGIGYLANDWPWGKFKMGKGIKHWTVPELKALK